MLEEVAIVFFRAVSHQLYGDANNHFHIRSLGIEYLVYNPEQFKRTLDFPFKVLLDH